MTKAFFLFALGLTMHSVKAQMVVQSGATVFLESGAKITVQGDLTSSASIQGTGTIVMKGSNLQNLIMNGNTIPNLEIDNVANITLSASGAKIGSNLLFTNGKLLTGGQDLTLSSTATVSGANASRFIWTDGAGMVRKELTADIAGFEMPVGENASYRPVLINSTGGSYSGASIAVRNASGVSANRPPSIASFAMTYWPVSRTGITGGTQTVTAQYVDPDIVGTETHFSGYYFNGTDWNSTGATADAATNRFTTGLASNSGEVVAMNRFLAVGTRALLQGAYTNPTVAGLMNDGLRAGGNVIPVGDPYRVAPYNSLFSHVNNTINELASGLVFGNQASNTNDIVDWVFLELRDNNTSPNAILQTRSALIQRDGDIVDVDGVSPVTFNNVTNGSYTIAVRHRNHLGISTAPASPRNFTETKSLAFSANVADLRSSGTALFGPGTNYTTASHPVLGTANVLWGGNVNANPSSSYQGPGNDRASLLTDLGGNQLTSLLNGYYRADLNFNKNASFQGPNNDRAYLLSIVLGGIELTSRVQTLPQ